jgi:hypothetical protein
MKTKRGLFFGFVVLALTAVFVLAGCDNPTGGDRSRDGTSGSNPFVGTWTGNVDGGTVSLTVTASTWEVTGLYRGTYTRNGNVATFTATHYWDGGWEAIPPEYSQQPTTVTVSGNTMAGSFEGQPMTFTKESGSDPSNPFEGAWTGNIYGEIINLTVTVSAWEATGFAKGTYTRNGNTATLTPTHEWKDGWVELPSAEREPATFTVSGNTMTGVFWGQSMAFAKEGASSDPSNPFVGTWTGNIYGEIINLTVTASAWEAAGFAKGTYIRNGNTATFTPTHEWYGWWEEIPSADREPATFTVSGNTMTGSFDGQFMTLAKGSSNTSGTLSNNVWVSATLTPGAIHSYSFYGSGGTNYYIYWEDYDYDKSYGDILVSARTSGGTYLLEFGDMGYDGRYIFVSSSGLITLEVKGYGSSDSGYYRIKFASAQ